MIKRAAFYVSVMLGLLLPVTTFAQDVYVRGHFRSDGTYVQPYYRSAPDTTLNPRSIYESMYPYAPQVAPPDPYAVLPGPYSMSSAEYRYRQRLHEPSPPSYNNYPSVRQ